MTRRLLPSVETLLRAALWSVLLAVIAFTRTDPDLWGHVRFGMDILRDAGFPRTDPYSFTSDRPWINHEWAAEIASGAAFLAAAGAGLVLLKLAVVAGSLVALDRALFREGVVEARRRDWMGAAAVITTIQQAHHVRPQLFSLLFFALLLAVLQRASAGDGKRWLFAVPPLFAVWANFHGGWIVGGAVLIAWTAGSALSGPDGTRTALRLGVAGLAALIATLANPYGFGLWRFLWDTVGIGRAEITDWQPVYALDASVWGLWIVTVALAAVGVARARRAVVEPRRMLVVLLLAAGSFLVNRLLGFFALATLFLFGAAIVGAGRARSAPAASSRRTQIVGMAIGVALLAGGAIALRLNVSCVRIDARTSPEPEAVAVLTRQPGDARLLVWFDWGEYAIWHLGPRMRVSIDGRRETVYSGRLQDAHLRFFFDAPGGAGLAREIQADYVWIPRDLPAARRLRADGWPVLFEGEKSVILARAGVAGSAASAARHAVTARCFPDR